MTIKRDGMTKDLAKNFDRFQPLRNYRTLSPLFAFIILANSTILPILLTRMTNERPFEKACLEFHSAVNRISDGPPSHAPLSTDP